MAVSKFQFFIYEISAVIIILVLLGYFTDAIAQIDNGRANPFCRAYYLKMHDSGAGSDYTKWLNLFTDSALNNCIGVNGSVIWGVLLAIIGISALIFFIPVITS